MKVTVELPDLIQDKWMSPEVKPQDGQFCLYAYRVSPYHMSFGVWSDNENSFIDYSSRWEYESLDGNMCDWTESYAPMGILSAWMPFTPYARDTFYDEEDK